MEDSVTVLPDGHIELASPVVLPEALKHFWRMSAYG